MLARNARNPYKSRTTLAGSPVPIPSTSMGKVRFHVAERLHYWAANGEKFAGGKWHTVDWTADELHAVAAAESQGSLDEVEWDRHGPPAGSVQPDEESVKILEQAQADGSWQQGNELQAVLDAYAKSQLDADIEIVEDEDGLEPVEKGDA